MFVEVTAEFRAALESVENRREVLGLTLPPKDCGRILPPPSSLCRQADRIVQHVSGLRKVLADQKQEYVAAHGGMAEVERDQVDAGADSIGRQCRGLIVKYREEVGRLACHQTAREHHTGVAEGLERYLKTVVSLHSEMKAVRLARQLRQKRLSRLEVTSKESRAQEIGAGQGRKGVTEQELQEKARALAAERIRSPVNSGYSSEEEELSPEEAQAMEMENDKLMEQLSSLTNQVI